jgi:hydroxymethylglutaryl-CoA lyase
MRKSLNIKITETPRDAMQGWPRLIPAELKAKYINSMLKVGFDTVDCGSFVSAKAIPQMADTAEVLSKIDTVKAGTKMMVLVGNTRGGTLAAGERNVQIIGFPYSVSPVFLKKNLNTSTGEAWKTILDLKNTCDDSGKELRVYLTMAFGNPYGDEFSDELITGEVEKLSKAGISDIVLSDITGEGTPELIGRLCTKLLNSFPDIIPGIHLHTKPEEWQNKVEASWSAGIRRFESALGGYGGCPMTGYELLANLNTLDLFDWCIRKNIHTGLNEDAIHEARRISLEIFG